MNICSYHLQEAGATPVQELAFALATAVAVLDTVKASGEVSQEKFGEVVGRISFFVNAGLRFITEMCKMRAFVELWDEITRERYGITDAKQRLFRYGVQVNSLGLTEPQPENNVTRILLEMLAVTLSKNARARAVQLPAWNEALGLPRPWDQQWSLRMQQILAYETDLLDYGDIFDGSAEIERKVDALKAEAKEELARIDEMGGAVAAVESGYMKQQLVEFEHRAAGSDRARRADRGRRQQISRDRALAAHRRHRLDHDGVGRRRARPARTAQGLARGARQARRRRRARRAQSARRRTAATSCRPRSPAPKPASPPANGAGRCARPSANTARRPASAAPCATTSTGLDDIRADVDRVSRKLGRRLTFLVGKPGLDGHSNGAEQIAVRARDAGMQVVYEGIRLTPEEIVDAAQKQKAHVIGLSVLSGSHLPLVQDVVGAHEGSRHDHAAGGRRHHPAGGRRRPGEIRRRRGLYAEGFRVEPHHVGRGAHRRARERREQRLMNDRGRRRGRRIWRSILPALATNPSSALNDR